MIIPNMFYNARNCPSCQGDAAVDNGVFSEPKAESLTIDEVQSAWAGFFRKKAFFSYHRCQQCGLLFCPTFFSEEQLAKLYANMADNTAGVPLEPLIKTQSAYYAQLKPYIPSACENYLELGPDIGLFTKCCVSDQLCSKYWLIEPNEKVWPELKNTLSGADIHLSADTALIKDIPDKSISVVVMIHVLDHLLNPLELLQQIKPKLRSDAVMMFVTHDERSWLAKLTRAKWPPYCLQHPQLYNRQSVAGLLDKVGMHAVAFEKTRNYFPVTYLLRHMLFILGIKWLPLPRFDRLQLGLKLGNLLTIARLR